MCGGRGGRGREGACANKQSFATLEAIHCRAARLVYILPKDTPSTNVRQLAHWAKLSDIYKVRLATLIFNINFQLAPPCMEFITKSRSTTHNLRNANNLAIPFSNSYYMKNSIAYREVPSSGISSHRLQMA